MQTLYKKVSALLLVVLFAASLVACGGATSSGGTQTIVIGASLPLTGSLGSFGPLIQTGYTKAVNDMNASGGISIGGMKDKIQLVVLDNKSDPNIASQQARTLLLKNNAIALLGGVSPALNIPISNIGEQLKHPVIQTLTPLQAWLSGRQGNWNYAWDSFFDEDQMTNLEFQTSNLVKTSAWRQILGPVAEGTMAVDWWSPSLGLPDTNTFISDYGKNGVTTDLSAIIVTNTVARVLLDAIAQANSLDPSAINTAIGKISKTYPVGHIQFGANHTAPLTAGMDQWQRENMTRVYPATQGAVVKSPVPGLG